MAYAPQATQANHKRPSDGPESEPLKKPKGANSKVQHVIAYPVPLRGQDKQNADAEWKQQLSQYKLTGKQKIMFHPPVTGPWQSTASSVLAQGAQAAQQALSGQSLKLFEATKAPLKWPLPPRPQSVVPAVSLPGPGNLPSPSSHSLPPNTPTGPRMLSSVPTGPRALTGIPIGPRADVWHTQQSQAWSHPDPLRTHAIAGNGQLPLQQQGNAPTTAKFLGPSPSGGPGGTHVLSPDDARGAGGTNELNVPSEREEFSSAPSQPQFSLHPYVGALRPLLQEADSNAIVFPDVQTGECGESAPPGPDPTGKRSCQRTAAPRPTADQQESHKSDKRGNATCDKQIFQSQPQSNAPAEVTCQRNAKGKGKATATANSKVNTKDNAKGKGKAKGKSEVAPTTSQNHAAGVTLGKKVKRRARQEEEAAAKARLASLRSHILFDNDTESNTAGLSDPKDLKTRGYAKSNNHPSKKSTSSAKDAAVAKEIATGQTTTTDPSPDTVDITAAQQVVDLTDNTNDDVMYDLDANSMQPRSHCGLAEKIDYTYDLLALPAESERFSAAAIRYSKWLSSDHMLYAADAKAEIGRLRHMAGTLKAHAKHLEACLSGEVPPQGQNPLKPYLMEVERTRMARLAAVQAAHAVGTSGGGDPGQVAGINLDGASADVGVTAPVKRHRGMNRALMRAVEAAL